jgi:APA family basic amino acid/polyamine antiporter
LGLVDLTAIGLNATVGSGIFLLPDDLFRAMGAWSPLAFLLCALGLLPVAWCYADAATRTDATGGPYVYAHSAFGPTLGFGVGWMCFANAVFSFAAVAAASAAYAERLAPTVVSGAGTLGFALLVIFAFGGLNYFGARPGALAVRAFTFGKFAVLLLLVSVLVPELEFTHAAATSANEFGLRGLGAATFMALFALQGFEVVSVPAGETKGPQAKAPFAILTTLLSAALLYVVVQCVLVFGFPGLGAPSDAPLAEAALALSPGLGIVVAIGALVSTLGFVSGSALGTPRYLFAMASAGALPASLARLHPRFRSPHLAVIATSSLAMILVLPFDYRTLIGMSNVAVAVQYGSTCLAVWRHTWLSPVEPRRRLRLWVSSLGAVTSSLVFLAATWEELLFAAAALAFGVVLSWGMRGLRLAPPGAGR